MNFDIPSNVPNGEKSDNLFGNFCEELKQTITLVMKEETGVAPEDFIKLKIQELRENRKESNQKITILQDILQNVDGNGLFHYVEQIFQENLFNQKDFIKTLEKLH
ncbi:hypothetical protein JW964_07070, partial [candidate division KSB1 bacterium]|nr:hypothetical protein [candidate division KSB1 bacterium]